MSKKTWGRRKRDNQAYVKSSDYVRVVGKIHNVPPPTLSHIAGAPTFLIDENMPKSLSDDLRILGYKAYDVRRLKRLGPGTSDTKIKNYAEEKNMVVITRDGPSFPEPKKAGDRLRIMDVKGEDTLEEVLVRFRHVGWA